MTSEDIKHQLIIIIITDGHNTDIETVIIIGLESFLFLISKLGHDESQDRKGGWVAIFGGYISYL